MTSELVKNFSGLFRPQKAHESDDAYTQRIAHHMLTEQNDPLVAAELILGKPHFEWHDIECAKWVLDYAAWFDTHLHARGRDIWEHFKEKYAEAVNQIVFIERRRRGEVTSNPIEMRTMEGRHAADVFKGDPVRCQGRPRWEGGILKSAPFGYAEAIRKREAVPVDHANQGHLLVRHIDKGGEDRIKQIVLKGEAIKQLPSLFPELPDSYEDDPRDFDGGPPTRRLPPKKDP